MLRILRKHSGYAAICTFVLAVSTGVNLLVFTVVNALWIRPLSFPDPDGVVTFPGMLVGALDHPDLHLPTFEGGVAGQVVPNEIVPWLRLPRIEIPAAGPDMETLTVTAGYFKVLRLAIRGRDFTDSDEPQGAEPVAIISHRLWSRVFERRSEVIGSVVPAQPVPVRVIGIAPPHFNGARRGEQVDVWIPLGLGRRIAPVAGARDLMILARLGPGETPALMTQRFDPSFRDLLRLERTTLTPVTEVYGRPESRGFVIREEASMLLAAGLAMLVLLGGCATLAALVLMHYEGRRGEFGLKMALGASRRRLIGQLARELSLLGAVGTAGGITVAALGVGTVGAFSLPGGVEMGRLDLLIDWRVLAVGIGAVGVTLVAAAALPVVRSTRTHLSGELVTASSAITLGSLRVRQALLALQVCAAIIILVAAGLFVRAVVHGTGGATGFDLDRTVFVSIDERGINRFAGDLQRVRAWRAERSAELMAVFRSMPGVSEVAEGFSPIGRDSRLNSAPSSLTVKVSGREEQLSIGRLAGSPELLSALGVPLLAGRSLSAADRDQVPVPAVITESLAQRLWPNGGGLGETFRIVQLRGGPYLVVGICRNVAFGSLSEPSSGVVVTVGQTNAKFVVRTGNPDVVAGLVRRTMREQGVRVATGREEVRRDIGRQRLGAWAFSGFGLSALLLGVGGAFGLVAYLAESRRREFGVRLALGADHQDLLQLGLIAALVPVSVGVAAGLILGGIISRVFEAVLVGISPLDIVTHIVVAAIMLSAAAIAALAAAWRLRRTSPLEALRTI